MAPLNQEDNFYLKWWAQGKNKCVYVDNNHFNHFVLFAFLLNLFTINIEHTETYCYVFIIMRSEFDAEGKSQPLETQVLKILLKSRAPFSNKKTLI